MIPKSFLRKITKYVFKHSKRRWSKQNKRGRPCKYDDLEILYVIVVVKVYNFQSLNQAYEKAKEKRSGIQTFETNSKVQDEESGYGKDKPTDFESDEEVCGGRFNANLLWTEAEEVDEVACGLHCGSGDTGVVEGGQ